MKFALIGGVSSTAVALDSLIRNGADVAGVLGYTPEKVQHVSDYVDMVKYAKAAGVQRVRSFTRVNDPSTVELLNAWEPDVLLVVGLSQLVSAEVRATARKVALGFHPTRLPKGRGRAPIAWLVLEQAGGAATLFEMEDQADAGDIFVQIPYEVEPRDHARQALDKCLIALDEAIRELVAKAKRGILQGSPQDHNAATYRGVRRPEDGRIDWNQSVESVDALIRASAEPHPGAYTVTPKGNRITFMWSGGRVNGYMGVPGRVLRKEGAKWLVACADGAILLGGLAGDARQLERIRDGDLIGSTQADLERLLLPSD